MTSRHWAGLQGIGDTLLTANGRGRDGAGPHARTHVSPVPRVALGLSASLAMVTVTNLSPDSFPVGVLWGLILGRASLLGAQFLALGFKPTAQKSQDQRYAVCF